MNSVILIGRLTRDPELRYTPSQIAVCNFTLAVDRDYKNAEGKREADFIDCCAWRQQAELCANYLAKGRMAAVEGSIQTQSYEKDGKRHYKSVVMVNHVQFLGSKNEQQSQQKESPAPQSDFGSYNDMNGDDDLPF